MLFSPERVPREQRPDDDGKSWYIPHHGVYHPQKPDKIRIVFDCSATFMGHSLNKYLLQGPDLTNSLVGVLCRFRKELIAFMCDLEAMFHQFKVKEEDRDYLRFYWWENGDITKTPVQYRMTVHLFGAASSSGCSNFGLKKTATDNGCEFGSDAAEFIRKDFYVDDGLKSVATVSEATSLIENTKSICARGGMRLHKFISNSKEVIAKIAPDDRAKGAGRSVVRGVRHLSISYRPARQTLDPTWNFINHQFRIRPPGIPSASDPDWQTNSPEPLPR